MYETKNLTKDEIEMELFKEGWGVQLVGSNYSVCDSINTTASMMEQTERKKFLGVAKKVLAKKGIKLITEEDVEKAELAKIFGIEKKFAQASFPIKLDNSRNILNNVFFELQCKERFPEERQDLSDAARSILKASAL